MKDILFFIAIAATLAGTALLFYIHARRLHASHFKGAEDLEQAVLLWVVAWLVLALFVFYS